VTTLIYLALVIGWAYIVDNIEDYLPINNFGFILLCALCVCNPFLWLFLRSLT
jgi:hypothetical protein